MSHPAVDNGTPFAFEPLFLADEEGRPLLVPVVKATYALTERSVVVATDQTPLIGEGVLWGEPDKSSYRYEPEGCLPKPATDVVLVGSAVTQRPGTTEMLVAFQVGALKKGVRVLGDRAFYKAMGSVSMTEPLPFERIPLQWERAFGGWDRSNPDEKKHAVETRNPVGLGFRGSGTRFEEGLRCPNLEDPVRPYRGWGDRPPPTGFGFTSPNWEPRVAYAGTYDQEWEEERAPLLPKNFDRRFLNAAAPDLIARGYLRGDEQVVVSGATASGGFAFKLPGMAPPRIEVEHSGQLDVPVETNLDTVVVDTDAQKLFLFWRGQLSVREAAAVRTIRIVPGEGTPPKTEG